MVKLLVISHTVIIAGKLKGQSPGFLRALVHPYTEKQAIELQQKGHGIKCCMHIAKKK